MKARLTTEASPKEKSVKALPDAVRKTDQGALCPGDVVVLPAPGGRWIAMNVFARTCLALDSRGIEFMAKFSKGAAETREPDFADQGLPVWEIEWFSHLEGLLADPTRFRRNAEEWPEAEILDSAELCERLKAHCLLIDDNESYLSRFAPKTKVLDHKHFGNFHQQLGQALMVRRRVSPGEWWIKQKFNEDLTGLRNTLYNAVQGHFLKRYLRNRFGPGVEVVDIGCGPGYFSNLIAATGARVLGVDPSENYIALAKKHAVPGARFERMAVGQPGGCDAIAANSVDYVFMSDALLFYFVAPDPNQAADIDTLFADIRRILKPDGLLLSVEPHYIFWLLPWLGEDDRPFTVLTEYRQKFFGVTPTISTLIQAFAKGGFAVTWMEEMYPDSAFEAVDPRAYHFACQFPLWQMFELKQTGREGRAVSHEEGAINHED